ncbi:MAG: sigma-70 family RNA polymerase sigma factor [Deltaproteobacteria bacterium]
MLPIEAELERFGPQIEAWLRASLRDPVDAEEAWSSARERIVAGFASLRADDERARCAWMYTIARREMYRLLERRARVRERERALRTDEVGRIVQSGPGLSTQLREADRRDQLERGVAALLEDLDPEETALLVLRFQEGASHQQISTALSTPDRPVSEAAVRKRLSRLTQRLRERASEAGLEDLSTP